MARPDPSRLNPMAYPHSERIQTRFQDLDPLGHINNVAMAALFESGRVRFNHAMGLSGWKGHRWLVARIEINYLAEGNFPADVEIATGIGEIGTRSWQILVHGVPAGFRHRDVRRVDRDERGIGRDPPARRFPRRAGEIPAAGKRAPS